MKRIGCSRSNTITVTIHVCSLSQIVQMCKTDHRLYLQLVNDYIGYLVMTVMLNDMLSAYSSILIHVIIVNMFRVY